MASKTQYPQWTSLILAASLIACPMARADVVTDWNITAADIVVAAKPAATSRLRVMALVQSAVYEAVNAITKRYPAGAETGRGPWCVGRCRGRGGKPRHAVEAGPGAAGRDRQCLPDCFVRHLRWPGEDRRDHGRGAGRRGDPRAARR